MKGIDRLTMRAALWAIPVLYIVSLLLTFFSPCKRDFIYFSVIGVALALGLTHGKPAQEGLISAETI